MARSRQSPPPISKLFDVDTKARIASAIEVLLDKHDGEALEALRDAEDSRLTITLKLEIDRSESAQRIDVDLRFTPKTITDSRTIICTDPAQNEFSIMTPAAVKEMQTRAKAAAKEAELAAGNEPPADPGSDPETGEDPEGEGSGKGGKSKKKKKS